MHNLKNLKSGIIFWLGISFLFLVLIQPACKDDEGSKNTSDDPTTMEKIKLDRFKIDGALSEIAALTLTFSSEEVETLFINAVADLNHDDLWESYPVNGAVQSEWVIQNHSALVTETEYSVYIKLTDPDVDVGETINAN